MIVHDAAAAFVALIDAALLWAEAIAAAVVFVAAVVAFAVEPLIAPDARREPQRPRGAPQTTSRGSRTAGTPPRPSGARVRPRVPSWAHTEPYTYEEAA